MAETLLMKGCEAMAEAAIRAGCRYFYAYPITPATELLEYMARKMPEAGGVCLQAESEVAAISMVYGSAAAGKRVMTASSGPGISLKQEGISFLAAAELPCLIVNLSRGGPGLGNIFPAQADYFQATRSGHGDYHLIVLAPYSVQEAADLVGLSFFLADKYRNPAMILTDGALGQMMEKVSFNDQGFLAPPEKSWASTGAKERERNLITTAHIPIKELAAHNIKLKEKYQDLARNHTSYRTEMIEDAKIAVVAFGTAARVALKAVTSLRAQGKKVGLLRPISLYPFPYSAIKELTNQVDAMLVVEMNLGQMIEDVNLAVCGARPVDFLGVSGGAVPTPQQIEKAVLEVIGKYC